MRLPTIKIEPPKISFTEEEILADLTYPAPSPGAAGQPKGTI